MEETYESRKIQTRDYWETAVRRRWFLMAPFFVAVLLAYIAGYLWPQAYSSEALILVEQQKVPEQYVTPNVVAEPRDRLQSMTQQILSRTRVRRLIEQFNLYPNERQRMPMDEVIDKMREHIRIELVQAPGRPMELTAFRIYFSAENPRIAQQITNELTSLFIEENLQARTQQSVGTTSFLESQLEKARQDLAEQEERQRQYKMQYLGQLPEQQQSNLQILSSLEAQLRATTDALQRAEQQKIYLESIHGEYQRMRRSLEEQDATGRASTGSALEGNVRETRKQLAEMEAKYTPKHPDVVRLKGQLARLEARQNADAGLVGKAESGASKAAASIEPNAIEIQSRLKAVSAEIDSRKRDTDELRKRIGGFQGRLDMTPVREQQLAEVTRSYENSRQYYQSLLQKKLQSELATNLEKRQQGEQFRILDPASLPQKPSQPNRLSILLIGWLVGISVGLGLTAFREIMDRTLRTSREVIESIQIPVLIQIPLLRSPALEVKYKGRRLMEALGGALGVLVTIGTGLHTYLVS